MLKGMLRHHSSASSSAKSDRSQLVDLVVEDTAAEDLERVRARKEGSAAWNEVEPRRFVCVLHSSENMVLCLHNASRTYPGDKQGEDIREGFDPNDSSAAVAPKEGEIADDFAVGDVDDDDDNDDGASHQDQSTPLDSDESRHWREAHEAEVLLKPKYGIEGEENVWAGKGPSEPPKENP